MNTNKPELEEFMVFVDKNGAMGVIIKNTYTDSDTYPWWKCYKDKTYGQVFNEQEKHYDNIDKLYKIKYNYYNEYFYALKFMNNGDLDSYNCVYEYKEEINDDISKILNYFSAYGYEFTKKDLKEFGLLTLIDKVVSEMSKENFDLKYKLSDINTICSV